MPRAVRSETRRKDLIFPHLTACHVPLGWRFLRALAYFVRYYSPEGHDGLTTRSMHSSSGLHVIHDPRGRSHQPPAPPILMPHLQPLSTIPFENETLLDVKTDLNYP